MASEVKVADVGQEIEETLNKYYKNVWEIDSTGILLSIVCPVLNELV